MTSKRLTLVVFVPVSHADAVRKALGDAGAGKIGNYSHCSFSVRGTGRFLGEPGSHPTVGEAGRLEAVEEERIETVVARENMPQIIAALKAAHPYEEPAFDLYALEDI